MKLMKPCGTRAAYMRGCRCSKCRAAFAAYTQRYRARRRLRDPQHHLAAKVPCAGGCGRSVYASRGQYCERCSLRAAGCMGRHQRLARQRIAKAAAGRSGGKRVFTVGLACGVCGQAFVRAGMASPYCSKVCSRRAAGRPPTNWIAPAVRGMLYRRDGYVCQLCGDPVDRKLDRLHKMAATLDHIVPRSRGGSDDPSNLRLAHRLCNSLRGDAADEFALGV